MGATVIEIYRIGFARAFERAWDYQKAGCINYNGLNWSAADAPRFLEALRYADRHCKFEGTKVPHLFWIGAFHDGVQFEINQIWTEIEGICQKWKSMRSA